jgi:hypothetical protein
MALRYLAGSRIEGLSGDTKPTTAQADSVFYETNTGKTFDLSGGTWTERSVDLSSVGIDTGTTGKSYGLTTLSDMFFEEVNVAGDEIGLVDTEVYCIKKLTISGNAVLTIATGGEVSLL